MRVLFLQVILLSILLFGCCSEKIINRDYLLLTGESENWHVKDYEVELSPDKLKAGNGTVIWKGEKELETDSFSIYTYAVINNQDQVLQGNSFSGDSKIKEESTGAIEGEAFFNEEGEPISKDEIENIYMVIEWWDPVQKKNVSERIDIFRKS